MHRTCLVSLALLLSACVPTAAQFPEASPFDEQAVQGEALNQDQKPAATLSGALVEERLLPTGLLEIGSFNAPHTLLLFVTPGSSYSQQYVADLLPSLTAHAVKAGAIKIHIAFVPFERYPQTATATAQLICAAKQHKGLAALPVIMQNPTALGASASGTSSAFDLQAMRSCAADPATASMASLHASVADSLHVTLVPTAFLDGEKRAGLPEWIDLRGWIDSVMGA